MEDEFKKLKEYLDIYVQLLPMYIQRKQEYWRLSFEDYKNTLGKDGYDMSVPHFKESFDLHGNTVVRVHTHGMGSRDGIGTRYYNTHNSIKYYTYGNVSGQFTISDKNINNIKFSLKNLK